MNFFRLMFVVNTRMICSGDDNLLPSKKIYMLKYIKINNNNSMCDAWRLERKHRSLQRVKINMLYIVQMCFPRQSSRRSASKHDTTDRIL